MERPPIIPITPEPAAVRPPVIPVVGSAPAPKKETRPARKKAKTETIEATPPASPEAES